MQETVVDYVEWFMFFSKNFDPTQSGGSHIIFDFYLPKLFSEVIDGYCTDDYSNAVKCYTFDEVMNWKNKLLSQNQKIILYQVVWCGSIPHYSEVEKEPKFTPGYWIIRFTYF